jgi:Domain of unknown function (DUF4388)
VSERRTLLSGSLEQLSVPDLLQTAEANRRSGVVQLTGPSGTGTIWLRDGRVVDGETANGRRAADAIYEMAFWDEGDFEADFTSVAVEETIFQPTSGLLLEAMRRKDEALRNAAPPHAAMPDPPPSPPRPLLAVHRGLTLVNVAASYASEHLEPALLAHRLEETRRALLAEHPPLEAYRVNPGGAVSAGPEAVRQETEATVRAVSRWLARFFTTLEGAMPGRFPLGKLRQITEAVQEDLESLGFNRELGFEAGRGE